MARCRGCHRPLRRPSPDGYGPKCRRVQRWRSPRWPLRYRGRPVRTLPDIDTYQETR